jgi:hypothetical protein
VYAPATPAIHFKSGCCDAAGTNGSARRSAAGAYSKQGWINRFGAPQPHSPGKLQVYDCAVSVVLNVAPSNETWVTNEFFAVYTSAGDAPPVA